MCADMSKMLHRNHEECVKILIGKHKRKRPLRRPRTRWEVQCKIKVEALLNIGLCYSALKIEAEHSSETAVPAQQTT